MLLDCDGVLANFAAKAVLMLSEELGLKTDIIVPDITDAPIIEWLASKIVPPELKDFAHNALYSKVAQEGFCSSIEPYPSAKLGVRELLNWGCDVRVLTSPFASKTWASERQSWVVEHFGITIENVIFDKKKDLVHGHIFVDDSPFFLQNWRPNHDGLAFLYDRPWNKNFVMDGVRRVDNWDTILFAAEDVARKINQK